MADLSHLDIPASVLPEDLDEFRSFTAALSTHPSISIQSSSISSSEADFTVIADFLRVKVMQTYQTSVMKSYISNPFYLADKLWRSEVE